MKYIYYEKYHGTWAVGFYTPEGKWIEESNYFSKLEAAKRVAWLNGVKIPTFTQGNLTLEELLVFVEEFLSNPDSRPNQIMMSRLKNILRKISQHLFFVDQINYNQFMNTRGAGQKSWLLFLETVDKVQKIRIDIKESQEFKLQD